MVNRMISLLLVAALGLAAAPLPLPTAAPSPVLKQIIDLHSTSRFCADFVTHANGAIDSDNLNDVALGDLVANLRHRDMGSSMIAWHNGITYLTNLSVAIDGNWKSGEREVNQLRALAATAKDPKEKKNLMDSANAIGGALWRQRKISRDLSGFIAYLNANQMVRESNAEHLGSFEDQPSGAFGDSRQLGGTSQWDGAMPTASTEQFGRIDPLSGEQIDPYIRADLVRASKSYARRLPAIGRDELHAAAAFTLASQGC